ncbi:hypothetical protein [Leeuwenhoekiella sp. H156]|uniref:hypothetical protein n=1 Tax=Leeuwenhoekiella sp. H156 TaxID=3450128 RepID=UPI003FA43438
MKFVYVLFVMLLVSCNQNSGKQTEVEAKNGNLNLPETLLSFEEFISRSRTKQLPHIDTTNFDRFIEQEDIKTFDVQALNIEKIYPDFYREGSAYQTMDSYRLSLSPDFYTLVITFRKGIYEMESVLINYDLQGKLIDHQVVAYDETAKGISRIESKISEGKIVLNRIRFTEETEIRQEEFRIQQDGKMEAYDSRNLSESLSDYAAVLSVLEELALHPLEVKTDLIASAFWNESPNSKILVIPEIVAEGDHYFELNSHIVLLDDQTETITHRFFESAKTNHWVSDAVVLTAIKIDTAQWHLSPDQSAFGIRLHYIGMSHANPYENETLSLFVKSGDSLQKVLNHFNVLESGGEWDTACAGEFQRTENRLLIAKEQTNDWFDITVKSNITNTLNEAKSDGRCISSETNSIVTRVLKYDGREYKIR